MNTDSEEASHLLVFKKFNWDHPGPMELVIETQPSNIIQNRAALYRF